MFLLPLLYLAQEKIYYTECDFELEGKSSNFCVLSNEQGIKDRTNRVQTFAIFELELILGTKIWDTGFDRTIILFEWLI